MIASPAERTSIIMRKSVLRSLPAALMELAFEDTLAINEGGRDAANKAQTAILILVHAGSSVRSIPNETIDIRERIEANLEIKS